LQRFFLLSNKKIENRQGNRHKVAIFRRLVSFSILLFIILSLHTFIEHVQKNHLVYLVFNLTFKELFMTISISQPKQFALYHYDSCPYCAKTRRAINDLELNVELKNIELNHQHRIDLQAGGHKTQVPCLRIEHTNGESQWLYESDDIINYLAYQQNELFRLALTA